MHEGHSFLLREKVGYVGSTLFHVDFNLTLNYPVGQFHIVIAVPWFLCQGSICKKYLLLRSSVPNEYHFSLLTDFITNEKAVPWASRWKWTHHIYLIKPCQDTRLWYGQKACLTFCQNKTHPYKCQVSLETELVLTLYQLQRQNREVYPSGA